MGLLEQRLRRCVVGCGIYIFYIRTVLMSPIVSGCVHLENILGLYCR